MGKKRAYKSRKSGGGRKKLKPEYDAGKNLKEQMESAVALYDSEMSLQAIGDALNLNPIKCVSWGVIFLCSFLYSQSLDFF